MNLNACLTLFPFYLLFTVIFETHLTWLCRAPDPLRPVVWVRGRRERRRSGWRRGGVRSRFSDTRRRVWDGGWPRQQRQRASLCPLSRASAYTSSSGCTAGPAETGNQQVRANTNRKWWNASIGSSLTCMTVQLPVSRSRLRHLAFSSCIPHDLLLNNDDLGYRATPVSCRTWLVHSLLPLQTKKKTRCFVFIRSRWTGSGYG